MTKIYIALDAAADLHPVCEPTEADIEAYAEAYKANAARYGESQGLEIEVLEAPSGSPEADEHEAKNPAYFTDGHESRLQEIWQAIHDMTPIPAHLDNEARRAILNGAHAHERYMSWRELRELFFELVPGRTDREKATALGVGATTVSKAKNSDGKPDTIGALLLLCLQRLDEEQMRELFEEFTPWVRG